MGKNYNNWWQDVPWGWVLVSVYCTTLLCAAVSEVAGQEAALTVLRDYQTLIAGLATIGALFIAMQQLKRQANRDAVDANRHHQAEIDALSELTRMATGLARRSSDPDESAIPFERSRWERLSHEVHGSLTAAISQVMKSVEEHNRLLDDNGTSYMAFNRVDRRQLAEACLVLRGACLHLLPAIAERRGAVISMIDKES